MPQKRSEHSQVAVAILSRAPLPGQSKTRLIPALGSDGAAELQRRMMRATVRSALAAALGPVRLWCAPDTAHPDFAACLELGPLSLHAQPTGDLGARMLAAFDRELPTLVVGTDCPDRTPALLHQAAVALGEVEAVVIPAEDDGYVLIGLRRPDARLFADIAWGGPLVLDETRQRLRDCGYRWNELAPLPDVDRPADLDRLAATHPELLAGLRQA